MNTIDFDIIEQYHAGDLNENQLSDFRKKISGDLDFKSAVEMFPDLIRAGAFLVFAWHLPSPQCPSSSGHEFHQARDVRHALGFHCELSLIEPPTILERFYETSVMSSYFLVRDAGLEGDISHLHNFVGRS